MALARRGCRIAWEPWQAPTKLSRCCRELSRHRRSLRRRPSRCPSRRPSRHLSRHRRHRALASADACVVGLASCARRASWLIVTSAGSCSTLHRFGQRNDQLVLAKLATLGQIDKELRELEEVLRDRRPVTVLREVGIAACPRCAAIHGSDDRFCPGCGLAFDAHADRPISTAPVSPQAQPPAPTPTASSQASPSPAPAPATAPAPTAARPAPATTPAPTAVRPPAPAATPAPTSARPPAPAATPAPTSARPPATEPGAAPAPVSPPAAKPSGTPVAAKPASPHVSPPGPPEQKERERAEESQRGDEDEPTQILRPPATGT